MAEVVADPMEYRKALTIDAGGELRQLDDVMDDWQRRDYEALDAGWRRVAGEPSPNAVLRAYLERPRGHDKTTGIATMATWALLRSVKCIHGVAAASDQDQAGLIRGAIQTIVQSNPWIGLFLKVHNYQVRNTVTGSTLDILATDAGGNYGQLLDFLIVDELTHWQQKKHQENWDALFSAVAKRPNCMLVIISNAGVGEGTGWQWAIREQARTRDDWYFSRIDGPKASWISDARLEEQRAMLPPAVYKRLWLNLWVPGTGDALSVDDIDAAMTLKGPQIWPGHTHLIGLDLGVKHDHAALAVLACKPGSGRVKLSYLRSWKPPVDGEIDLQAVRNAVRETFASHEATVCFYDPHQCKLMAQELASEGYRMQEVQFVGKNLTAMASAVLQSFSGRKIDLYPDGELRRDLLRLMIVEKPYGYKLEAISDEHGHADRAVALALALPTAAEISQLGTWRSERVMGTIGDLTGAY